MNHRPEARLTPEFAVVPIPVFAWQARDGDFVLADYNEAAERFSNGRAEQFRGRRASTMYADQPHMIACLNRALTSTRPWQEEMDYTSVSTGARRLLNATFARVADDVVLFFMEDITRKRAAEAELRESELRYRTLVEGAPDGIVVHRGGVILFVNEAFATMMRAPSREAMVGVRVLDCVHPDDRAQVLRRVRDVENGKAAPIASERLMRFDGTVVYAEIAGIPTTYDGAPAVQAIVRDVSERRKAEALFVALSEQSLTGVSVVQDGRLLYVNPRCAELFGYTQEEIIGMPSDHFVDESSREFVRHMQRERSLKGEGRVHYTFTTRRKDGSTGEIEVYGTVIELDGKPALVGTLLDASERERMAQQLRQSQKMEAVGQLAGGVAHDFNNILTAISAYTEFLLQELPEGSALRKDVLEIRDAGVRAAALTRQLLAFSRRQALQPRLVDVNDVLEGVERMFSRLIGAQVIVTSELGERLPKVIADPGQLEQVLVNLIVNARDAMPQGGRLSLRTSEGRFDPSSASAHPGLNPGHYVCVEVSDTGKGMASDVAARIFEPFFTTKPAGQGTGLGLSVVYGIVKQSGGYIMVDSEEGRGTRFTVLLPAVEDNPKDSEAEEPQESAGYAKTGRQALEA